MKHKNGNKEMIEVIVDGKTAREKLFDTYSKGMTVFTPKNKEIREYCEFLQSYGCTREINYLEHFFVMEINEKKYRKTNNSPIEDNENFLFVFPYDYPEEELFYFKLKYG